MYVHLPRKGASNISILLRTAYAGERSTLVSLLQQPLLIVTVR